MGRIGEYSGDIKVLCFASSSEKLYTILRAILFFLNDPVLLEAFVFYWDACFMGAFNDTSSEFNGVKVATGGWVDGWVCEEGCGLWQAREVVSLQKV